MLSLSTEQRMIYESAREISEPFAERMLSWDGDVPWENLQILADNGFLGVNIPKEYGGGGMTELENILVMEAVGRHCPYTASYLASQSFVAPRAITMFGSETAKEKYLPALTAGESLVAIAMSEPHAGSDVGNMNTHVSEDEDGDLYLSGEKIWVSQFPEADAAVVWAKFPEGIGTVIMDLDSPGIEVNTHFTNMAGDTQTHFYMDDVFIPAENVLVRGKAAFKEQLKALNWERCGVATLSNAIALCAFDKALSYAKEREQFGQHLSEFQGIRWKLADVAKQIQASRRLTYQTAITAQEQGRIPDKLEVSIAKLFSSEMVENTVSEALQIHGATGYQQEHPLEYLYRMARGKRIAGGTDEIVKNTIADALLNEGIPDL